jgi:hypothetical protein
MATRFAKYFLTIPNTIPLMVYPKLSQDIVAMEEEIEELQKDIEVWKAMARRNAEVAIAINRWWKHRAIVLGLVIVVVVVNWALRYWSRM